MVATRVMIPRRLLMCPPTHFDIAYSINPWMVPENPADGAVALTQWERLRDLYIDLGHTVEIIEPVPGLPDMVFAANGAKVVDGRVLGAKFRYPERAAEGAAYLRWFREHGFTDTCEPRYVNEGEGDLLLAGRMILAGSGFRSDRRSHGEARDYFGLPVVSLTLIDPRYYHLDTALAVLSDSEIMYYPSAFSPSSRRLLEELFPDAVIASAEDASVFGLNAFCDGLHVLIPDKAAQLKHELHRRGFESIGVELSELLKAGGSVKCCTLELQ
jgi:N-dimethylarginine dimethylaminohydrolase